MDTVFKKGDRVYDAMLGWGEFVKVNPSERSFEVLFDTGTSVYYDENGALYDYQKRNQFKPTLSFTEYTLKGFTQERPEELPNYGDIIWVRDSKSEKWRISHFIKKEGNKYYASLYVDANKGAHWNEITTKNPYTNEGSI